MTSQTLRFDNPGTWILILGIGLAGVSMAQAAEPAGALSDRRLECRPGSPPLPRCRPARPDRPVVPSAAPGAVEASELTESSGIRPQMTIEEKLDRVRRTVEKKGLSPETVEKIIKDLEKDLREEAARPKLEPLMTGILPGDMIGSSLGAGSSIYLIENGWSETVNGKRVMVYAGSMRRDLENDGVYYDPLTVHGFVIIIKGRLGEPGTTWNEVYTPTAVGSLHIVAAKGTLLTLQSRQGNMFLLNVETEQLTALARDKVKNLREYEARPKPEPVATGILLGHMIGGDLDEGSSRYFIENGWRETVNGEEVMVYAGSYRFDPRGDTIKFDPLTVHGFVIIDKGDPGDPRFKRKQLHTPTAVGSLYIVAAKGTVLTLQSRQGDKFLLNVVTEQLTPLGKHEPRSH